MCENAYDKIIDCLFLGSAGALQMKKDFSLIVNCTREEDIPFPHYCHNCIRLPVDNDFDHSHLFLKLMDETKVLEKIHYALINKEDVLVHCFAGIQRSCAVVACYLIKYHKMKANDAIHFIQSKRSGAFSMGISLLSTIVLFEEYYIRQ
jgi:hypothetical protein